MAPTKKAKSEFIQIRVTTEEKRRLQRVARRAGKTMTEMLIASALETERKMDRAA